MRDNTWYFTDSTWIEQLFKSKSGYYARNKGWEDGDKQITSPPCKQGYYYDEYMKNNRDSLNGLPF
ncbi:MAG TPA: hypothetical protein VFC67_14740 [Prolixibacteraceae bacterium]|nr:hypothetical protein [Prolixibacteraceae bacterium]